MLGSYLPTSGLLMTVYRRTCGTPPEFTWLTLALQLHQGRHVHSNRIQQLHHCVCPDCPDPKARCFFVNLNTLAHSCPNRAYAITTKDKWVAGIRNLHVHLGGGEPT